MIYPTEKLLFLAENIAIISWDISLPPTEGTRISARIGGDQGKRPDNVVGLVFFSICIVIKLMSWISYQTNYLKQDVTSCWTLGNLSNFEGRCEPNRNSQVGKVIKSQFLRNLFIFLYSKSHRPFSSLKLDLLGGFIELSFYASLKELVSYLY